MNPPISMPPQTSLQQTKEIEQSVRAALTKYPEVRQLVTQVGRPDDGTDPKGPNNLEVLAELHPREKWRFPGKAELVDDMRKKLRELPGIPTNFSQVIQDNVEVSWSSLLDMDAFSMRVAQKDMARLPEILQAVSASGASVRSVEVLEPNLEAVFLHLTGKALRD